ncbi:MAG: outer membrane protein assembly factor BamC [Gammaproteobacteria bacterium]
MRLIVKSLIFIFFLAACGTSEERRYRDTSNLELPPTLQPQNNAGEQPQARDDSAIAETKPGRGLGDGVAMKASEPPLLSIRQPFDIAWNTLESALKQSGIEINDRNLDQGRYYVTFDADDYEPEDATVFSDFGALFVNDYEPDLYVLTVTNDGAETQISAVKAARSEQGGPAENRDSDQAEGEASADGSNKLLMSLYKTIRDDLIDR